jgi:septum formation inhibitor MinC
MVAGAAAAPAACVVVLIAAGRRLPLHAAQPGTTLKILQKKRWPARKLKVQAPIAAPSFWSSSRKSSRERRKGSRRSIAVRSQTSQTEENGENGSHRSGDRESAGSSPPLSSCLYLRRTVRAGELLEYQGTVVVLGNVSQGAAIVADGDIIVLGHLQGNVHAGARCSILKLHQY